MVKCYYCEEIVGSYGWDKEGNHRCITCENLKGYYQNDNFGTPIENCYEDGKFREFKIGDKVEVEYCGDWFKGRIYTIEIFKTPKGDFCHYLCYYEHPCYNKNKEVVENFGWFKQVRNRKDKAKLIDDDISHEDFGGGGKRKFGVLILKRIPKKILGELNNANLKQQTLVI